MRSCRPSNRALSLRLTAAIVTLCLGVPGLALADLTSSGSEPSWAEGAPAGLAAPSSSFTQELVAESKKGVLRATPRQSAAPKAEAFEEVLLQVSVMDAAPQTALVYRRGQEHFVAFTHAAALGLPLAAAAEVPGIPEPVIAGLSVVRADDESLQAEVPLTYFEPQSFRYLRINESKNLSPLPAAWLTYDIYHQPTEGLRALGGTMSMAASHDGVSLLSLWQLNRDPAGTPLLRAATTLQGEQGRYLWQAGDVAAAQQLPVLSNRQLMGLSIRNKELPKEGQKGLGFSGLLPSSGVLSVLADQQLLYRSPALRGAYEVQGLPTLPGETRYQLVLEDGTGIRLLDSFTTNRAITLLEPGDFVYQLSAGAPREQGTLGVSAKYEKTLAVDAFAQYGLDERHNLQAAAYLYRPETWLGGVLRSEWRPGLTSSAGLFRVSSPERSSWLQSVSAEYNSNTFRAGVALSRFGDERGTPVDGFVSENKVFATWHGFNVYVLSGRANGAFGPADFRTTGISQGYSWGRTTLNVGVSRTERTGVKDPAFFSVLLSWSPDVQTRVSANLSTDRSSASASYSPNSTWGLTSEVSRTSNGPVNYNAGGYYNTRWGTLFGNQGSGLNTVGLSGSASLFRGPTGWDGGFSGRQAGDSLLVVDAASPEAELTVESYKRFKADKDGYAVLPVYSGTAQRIELDLFSLPPETTAANSQFLVQTKPYQALLLQFKLQSVGFGLRVVFADNAPVPEGSRVYFGENTTLVSADGEVWLDTAEVPRTLTIQYGPKQFCTVSEPLADAENVCVTHEFTGSRETNTKE